MKSYQAIKAELARLGLSSKNFTSGFYNDYIKARSEIISNTINGVDLSYCKNGIYLTHEMDSIYNSPFYLEDGYIYCEFLSAFYDGLTEFRIDCYVSDDYGFPVLAHSCRRRYDDLQEAKEVSASVWSEYSIVDVMEV